MARPFTCPKCGEDISESHMDWDPDCGIAAGWFCERCNEACADDGDDDYDYDR